MVKFFKLSCINNLLMLNVHFKVKSRDSSCHRALNTEFDELNSRSHEAEKEVNVWQMKIQEVNDNLSKHRKDLECMCFLIEFPFIAAVYLC